MRLRSRLCACSAALAIALPPTALPALADPSGDDRAGGIEREEQTADEEPSAPDDAPAAPDDAPAAAEDPVERSEEHTSELQSRGHLVCRLLLEKKKKKECMGSSVSV